MSDGKTTSRVIRAETARTDAHRPQAAAPIAAHATAHITLRLTRFANADEAERKAEEVAPKISAIHDLDEQKRRGAELDKIVDGMRTDVAHAILGGKLDLVFQRASGTQTWSATVVTSSPKT